MKRIKFKKILTLKADQFEIWKLGTENCELPNFE